MAQRKKQQDEFKPISMPIPNGEKQYTLRRNQFNGLNYASTINSGYLSKCANISTVDSPLLAPSNNWYEYGVLKQPDKTTNITKVLSMQVVDKYAYVFYVKNINDVYCKCINLKYIEVDGNVDLTDPEAGYDMLITENADDTTSPRYIADFNRYDNVTSVVDGKFARTLIVVPDMKRFEYKVVSMNNLDYYKWDNTTKTFIPTSTKVGTFKFSTFADVIAKINSSTSYPLDLNTYYRFTEFSSGGSAKTVVHHYQVFKTELNTYGYKSAGKNGDAWSYDEYGYFEAMAMKVDQKVFRTEETTPGTPKAIYFKSTDKKYNPYKDYYTYDESTQTYTKYTTATDDGADISDKDFYEPQGYLPPQDSDKNQYWYNTANASTYAWFDGRDDYGNIKGWRATSTPAVPQMDFATVYLSRLFGVGDGKVYASGYNNPSNWTFDVGDNHDDKSPWCSVTNANTSYNSEFTAIVPYGGNVIVFKEDCIQEVSGTRNPFSVQDIFTEGCVSQDTVQIVNGTLLFLSKNGVMAYTGYKPKRIGDRLNIKHFKGTHYASANDGRVYYLYYETDNEKRLFTYDTWLDSWCEEVVTDPIIALAYNTNCKGVLMITERDGDYIFSARTKNHKHNWSCETDMITSVSSGRSNFSTYDVKRMKHLQIAYTSTQEDNYNNSCKVYLLKDHEEFDEDESILLCDLDCEAGFHIEDKVIRGGAVRDFKLHIEGKGYVKIENIQIAMAYGGVVTDE